MKSTKKSHAFAGPRWVAWLLFFLLVGLRSSVGLAQSDKPRPAVIAIHAEPSRILDSNFGKALGLQTGFRYDPMAEQLWKAKSMKGVISLPEDIQPFLERRPGTAMPFHYYFEFELSHDQHARDLKAALRQRMPDQEDRDGATFFYPPFEPGAYLAVTKDRRAIAASEAYEYDPRRFPALTDTAGRLYKEVEMKSGGVALDIQAADRLVRSAIEFGKDNLPPPAKAYLTLPERLVSASGSLVLVPEPEVKVVIDCVDRDSAAEVLETVQELLTLAKLSLRESDPQTSMQKKFLETIKSEADGRQVVLSALIPTEILERIRAAGEEAQKINDVKQALLAVHNYYNVHKRFPFNPGPNENSELSWRVRMLPYYGEGELFEKFDLSQSWNSDTNRPLLDLMPRVFGEGNQTQLRWVESNVTGFQDITDGSSNTVAVIYGSTPVPWTEHRPLTHDDAIRMFLALEPDDYLIIGRYDGSVQRITSETSVEVFEALLTPDGGEITRRER